MLAGRFGTLNALENATLDDIAAIEGIGPETARSVRHFFDQDENREAVKRLLESGVTISAESAGKNATVALKPGIAGKTFVLTGTMENRNNFV